jgi:rubrerythrin
LLERKQLYNRELALSERGESLNQSKELTLVIHTALQLEKKGLKFYKASRDKVSDPNSRGLLDFLVSEEEQHYALFDRMAKNYAKPKSVKAHKIPLFTKTAYKKVGKKRALTVHIFNTALEMEEIGIRFYLKMAMKTTDMQLKKFLITLADMEKRHFKLIKEHQAAIYDAWYWQAMDMPALNT